MSESVILSPVDMQCLKNITGGNSQSIQKLVDGYLRVTKEQLEKMDQAIHSQSAGDVEMLSHNCIGCSDLLGMTAIVPTLRQLEQMAVKQQLTHAELFLAQAWKELERMTSYFEARKKGMVNAQSTYC